MTRYEFTVKERHAAPICEQMTILTYDSALDEWSFFTDNPAHAKKWERLVEPSYIYPSYKVYDVISGELIGLEGTISGRVILSK